MSHPPCTVKYPSTSNENIIEISESIPDLRTAPRDVQNMALLAIYFNRRSPGAWRSQGTSWCVSSGNTGFVVFKFGATKYEQIYQIGFAPALQTIQDLDLPKLIGNLEMFTL